MRIIVEFKAARIFINGAKQEELIKGKLTVKNKKTKEVLYEVATHQTT